MELLKESEQDIPFINYEQIFHQLEQNYTILQQQNHLLEKKSRDENEQFHALEDKYKQLKQQFETLQSSCLQKDLSLIEKNNQLSLFQDEKKRLLEINEKQQLEIDRLSNDVETLSRGTVDVQARLSDVQNLLSESHSQKLELEYTVNKLRSEIQTLKHQQQLSDQQLYEKNKEVIEAKRENATTISQLQISLTQTKDEVNSILQQLQLSKSRCDQQTQQINALLDEKKELTQNLSSVKQELMQKLTTQTKLTEVYKKQYGDECAKVAQVVQSIEKLNSTVEENKRRYQQDILSLQSSFQQVTEELKTTKQSLEECLQEKEKLQEELTQEKEKTKILDISDESSTFSFSASVSSTPTSSASSSIPASSSSTSSSSTSSASTPSTSSIFASPHSNPPTPTTQLTHTQLYSKYVSVVQEWKKEKLERKKLEGLLLTIRQEVDETAPAVQQKNYMYGRMKEMYEQNQTKLNESIAANMEKDEKINQLMMECELLEKEKQQIKQENDDLARQVRRLLVEQNGADNDSSPQRIQEEFDLMNPTDYINEHLVTFGSVEELHAQNIRLLETIHKLTVEHEKQSAKLKEMSEKKKQEEDPTQELAEAIREIQKLKAEREPIKSQLDLMTEKYNLSQEALVALGLDRKVDETESVKQLTARLSEQRNAYESLQTELNACRKEYNSNITNLQLLLDTSRRDTETARVALAKSEAEVKFLKEKYELLYGTHKMHEREIEILSKKNSELSSSLIRHQTGLTTATQELTRCQEEVKKLSIDLANARMERETAKQTVERFANEIQQCNEQRIRCEKLLQSMESM